jgi:hypothetical protein
MKKDKKNNEKNTTKVEASTAKRDTVDKPKAESPQKKNADKAAKI